VEPESVPTLLLHLLGVAPVRPDDDLVRLPAGERRPRLEREELAGVAGDALAVDPDRRVMVHRAERERVRAGLGDGDRRAVPADGPAVADDAGRAGDPVGVGNVRQGDGPTGEAA